jgi:hypothetical protein
VVRAQLPLLLAEAADAAEMVLRDGLIAAMNRVNPPTAQADS